MKIVCPSCGMEIDQNRGICPNCKLSLFCTRCGERVTSVTSETVNPVSGWTRIFRHTCGYILGPDDGIKFGQDAG